MRRIRSMDRCMESYEAGVFGGSRKVHDGFEIERLQVRLWGAQGLLFDRGASSQDREGVRR